MDETALDPDVAARAIALEAAIWFYDRTETTPADPTAIVFLAECFMHYLTNGEANEFDPKSAPIKCVRGG